MRKIRNCMKIGILAFGITFLLTNCENKNGVIENTKQENRIIVKQLNYQDILNDDKVIQKIDEINLKKEKLLSDKSTGNKYIANFNFYIDLETAKTVESNNYKTFNFLITRDNPEDDKVENLFLILNNNNEYDAFIIKYDFTAQELTELDQNTLNQRTSGFTPINIDFSIDEITTASKYICYDIWIYVPCDMSGPHGDGSTCNDTWVLGEACDFYYEGAGIPTGGNNSDTDPNDNIEPGGSSGNTTNNNYVFSTPVTESPTAIMLDAFFEDLTLKQDSCLSSQGLDMHKEIKTFLLANFDENSTALDVKFIDAKNFAKLVLDNCGSQVDWLDKIIDNFTGKAECVYEKLKSSSTDFKSSIKKFDGEFPVSHLKFKMGDLGNTRATTDAPDGVNGNNTSPDYVITITLNNNSNEHGVDYRPNLMNVKTIAHEVIHAEMFRKLLSVLDNGGTISGVTRQQVLDALDGNFPGMYDYFRRHKNWQHQQMATHYRDAIARIMQEYDTGIAVPNNQQPSQLYMDLSWEGLIYENGTNAIYTWTSLPQTERERIKGVISSYIDNNKHENCN